MKKAPALLAILSLLAAMSLLTACGPQPGNTDGAQTTTSMTDRTNIDNWVVSDEDMF